MRHTLWQAFLRRNPRPLLPRSQHLQHPRCLQHPQHLQRRSPLRSSTSMPYQINFHATSASRTPTAGSSSSLLSTSPSASVRPPPPSSVGVPGSAWDVQQRSPRIIFGGSRTWHGTTRSVGFAALRSTRPPSGNGRLLPLTLARTSQHQVDIMYFAAYYISHSLPIL